MGHVGTVAWYESFAMKQESVTNFSLSLGFAIEVNQQSIQV